MPRWAASRIRVGVGHRHLPQHLWGCVGHQEDQLDRPGGGPPRRLGQSVSKRLVEGFGIVVTAVGHDRREGLGEGLDVGGEVERRGEEFVALVAVQGHAQANVHVTGEPVDALGHLVDGDLELVDLVLHRAGGVEKEQDIEGQRSRPRQWAGRSRG